MSTMVLPATWILRSINWKIVNGRQFSSKAFRLQAFPTCSAVNQIVTFPCLFSRKLKWRGFSLICTSQSERGTLNGMTKDSYLTLCGQVRKELEVKRSKFVAIASPVEDENAASLFLSKVSDSKATHNCWAYKIGDRYRFSDDGEPGGTAGRPIYAAIEASGLDRVVLVVIRYFGGTKLGTGGLVRAYGRVASDSLSGAATSLVKAKISVTFSMPCDLLGTVYPLDNLCCITHMFTFSSSSCRSMTWRKSMSSMMPMALLS
ncbi:hypothetical protein O6H91_06G011700 [Diphasiastrum complanatum]|uniref:Uncharacterized protein n=1 Tax=Diphasiastrum complanatum TaxID=34168 RepID=A0ACC2DBM4_DIPCM|nr:hypothetical protein O6H91_06G011700 [Diphasiastrum complanatum]